MPAFICAAMIPLQLSSDHCPMKVAVDSSAARLRGEIFQIWLHGDSVGSELFC